MLCFLKILLGVDHKIVQYYLYISFHKFIFSHALFPKQWLTNALHFRCFLKLHNIYKKASVGESLLNKFADLKATNLLKRDSNTEVFQ